MFEKSRATSNCFEKTRYSNFKETEPLRWGVVWLTFSLISLTGELLALWPWGLARSDFTNHHWYFTLLKLVNCFDVDLFNAEVIKIFKFLIMYIIHIKATSSQLSLWIKMSPLKTNSHLNKICCVGKQVKSDIEWCLHKSNDWCLNIWKSWCIVASLVRSVRRVRLGLKHLVYHPLLRTLLCRPRLDFSLTSLSHPLLKRTSFARHVHRCIKNSPSSHDLQLYLLTNKGYSCRK